ncbi:4Fe-4S dicluster domain-containing protein [Candidatus Bathyarchaeota archaeon]|nr:4Fe-4S dicluster domain-containing protein [Candidatus Bathyarchaeota archaeon]
MKSSLFPTFRILPHVFWNLPAFLNPMARERFLPMVIHENTCRGCGRCLEACSNDAIIFRGSHRFVDYKKCKACASCIHVCPVNAITVVSIYEGDTMDIQIDSMKCQDPNTCHSCIDACPYSLYSLANGSVLIHKERINKCKACKACEKACPTTAVHVLQA